MQKRVVSDTNIIWSAHTTKSPKSPNLKVLDLWKANVITLLYSDDILIEYIEKLKVAGVSQENIETFIEALILLAEQVKIQYFHLHKFPSDMDDVYFLLCAVNGQANYLLSNDNHLLSLKREYEDEFNICKSNEFLNEIAEA